MTAQSLKGLRLLIVGPYPPPFGGIASHLVTLIPGLRRNGAEDIAVVSFGNHDAIEEIDGATLYRLDARRHGRELLLPTRWKTLAATLKELTGVGLSRRQILAEASRAALIDKIATKHRSQVVSFYQSDVSLSLMPCATMWGPRRSVVLTVFGECFDNPVFFSGREAFVTRYLNRPHAIVSSSKHCANSFSKVGVQRPIEPVYYGIDLERFAAPQLRDRYRTEIGVNPNEILVVYMGRFTDEMGLGRVIDVAPKIFAKMPAARLLLAGAKGPLGPSAQALAERFPDKVRIMNDVPFAVQPSVYAASDMVLAPSHDQHACMGMSIKEAMAASRPVIGSLAGGIPEAIVDEETGFLVPLDATRHIDASQLLDRIERLVVDADLRTGMGEAARRRAEAMFSMERTIDRMGEIFVAAMPA